MIDMNCKNCGTSNESNAHYCKKCGSNLTSTIEKTDVLRFVYKTFFIVAIIISIYTVVPVVLLTMNPLCIDGSCIGSGSIDYETISIISIPVGIFAIGFVFKSSYKRECMKNIGK